LIGFSSFAVFILVLALILIPTLDDWNRILCITKLSFIDCQQLPVGKPCQWVMTRRNWQNKKWDLLNSSFDKSPW
jgi:hypothetical protein